jgi:hypothetical protein
VNGQEQQKLTESGGAAGDGFGAAAAIGGSTALIGANGTSSLPGAAFVFTNSAPATPALGAWWPAAALLLLLAGASAMRAQSRDVSRRG